MNRHDERYYGVYGGRYVPEVLRPAFVELEEAWASAQADRGVWTEVERLCGDFIGRPTPLYLAENLSRVLGGPTVYLKLEGLANTGAHKINNALGQALLAKRMGKTRLIAETGAGQHGLATAAAAARFGLECEVFMGELDMERQHPNVFAMRTFGAKVRPVTEGSRTLTDAVNAALKNWTERVSDTHYVLGSALGPHPYPGMVARFQSVIGREARAQILEREGRLPDAVYACVGGGSNSIGIFQAFLADEVALVGVEAGGRGTGRGMHAVRMDGSARVGVVQAYKSYFLQDEDGSLLPTHSVSAGLDYAGIGPQLAWLGDSGRLRFIRASDDEAVAALGRTARAEGILPALESAHALAGLFREAPSMDKGSLVIVNVSGRGDKDLFITAPLLDRGDWIAFLERELAALKAGGGGAGPAEGRGAGAAEGQGAGAAEVAGARGPRPLNGEPS
ncbi:MAG TPA: tryptophan synthase subunit beta [Rectinemataceae bacterium]|nr:tryptophan synthase subunit beta [Rectinemataceae bacterium]